MEDVYTEALRTAALVTAHAVFSCLAGIKTRVMCFHSILCCSKTKKPTDPTHTPAQDVACVFWVHDATFSQSFASAVFVAVKTLRPRVLDEQCSGLSHSF